MLRLLTFLLLLPMFSTSFLNAQSLEDYQWKNRIVLLIENSESSGEMKEQLKKFQSSKKEMKERDLLLLLVTIRSVLSEDGSPTTLDREKILKQFRISPKFNGVALIGKDGGLKLKQPFLIAPQKVYDLIDSMPMRKNEMRNQ